MTTKGIFSIFVYLIPIELCFVYIALRGNNVIPTMLALYVGFMVFFVVFFQFMAALFLSVPLLGFTMDGILRLVLVYASLILPYSCVMCYCGLSSLIITNKAILYLLNFICVVIFSIISPKIGNFHLLPTNIITLLNQEEMIDLSLRDGMMINVVSIILTSLCIVLTHLFMRSEKNKN